MHVSRVILVLGALILAGTSSQVVSEQTDKIDADRWLIAKYDANGDQVISADEVGVKREKLFSYMDGDADGQVSFGEYQQLDVRKRQLLLQARFDKLDLDRDGELSAAEYSSYLGSFERFDQNGDGYVSSDEMAAGEPMQTSSDEDTGEYCLLWVCLRSSIH